MTLGEREGRWVAHLAQTPRTGQAPAVVVARRAAIEAVDQALVTALHAQGYLPKAFAVRIKPAHQRSRSSTSAQLRLASRLILGTDDLGWTRPLAPHVGPDTWQETLTRASWAHWGTLLHEAGHAVFARLAHPFQTDRLPAVVVDDLNTFLLGPTADSRNYFARVFNETFADVYGAMLLDRIGPTSAGAQAELAQLVTGRRQMREHDADPALAQRQVVLSLPQLTDRALTRALADRSAWQHLTGDALVGAAQRYASDGWLDLVLPGRSLGPTGEVLDGRLIHFLGNEMGERLTTSPLVPMLAHQLIHPRRSRLNTWRTAYPDHPVLRELDRVTTKLRGTDPQAVLYAALPAEQRVGAATAFLTQGLARRAGALQAEVAERCGAIAQALTALGALEAATAPSNEGNSPLRRRRGP